MDTTNSPPCTQRTARHWGGRCSGGLLVGPAARGRVGGAIGAAWPTATRTPQHGRAALPVLPACLKRSARGRKARKTARCMQWPATGCRGVLVLCSMWVALRARAHTRQSIDQESRGESAVLQPMTARFVCAVTRFACGSSPAVYPQRTALDH